MKHRATTQAHSSRLSAAPLSAEQSCSPPPVQQQHRAGRAAGARLSHQLWPQEQALGRRRWAAGAGARCLSVSVPSPSHAAWLGMGVWSRQCWPLSPGELVVCVASTLSNRALQWGRTEGDRPWCCLNCLLAATAGKKCLGFAVG